MVQFGQNHWKTIEVNGGLKKTLTIPSLWKIDHCCGLAPQTPLPDFFLTFPFHQAAIPVMVIFAFLFFAFLRIFQNFPGTLGKKFQKC